MSHEIIFVNLNVSLIKFLYFDINFKNLFKKLQIKLINQLINQLINLILFTKLDKQNFYLRWIQKWNKYQNYIL